MTPLPAGTVASMCGGSLIQGCPSDLIPGVSKDTRTLKQGEMYVALSGENFEGHDFIPQATEGGASAVLVSQLTKDTEGFSGAVIHVKDTLAALQELARNYRNAMEDIRVIGITGSNGKTSTKDFVASVLAQKYKVNATEGNLNNHIGLPMTVLNTEADDTAGVWEMGMSHPGEIELLAGIGRPEIGIITNTGVAHLEFMKSREAIAQEKGMLAESLSASGCLFLSEADEYTESIRNRTKAQVMTVGISCGDWRAENLNETVSGTRFEVARDGEVVGELEIAVPGQHMVVNALFAAALGHHLGVDWDSITEGLKESRLSGGRLQRRSINGIEILDDSYNANPDSMRAALQTLADVPCEGKRVAALGVMAELGEEAEQEHRALGGVVKGAGVDVLVTVGDLAALAAESVGSGVEAKSFEDCEQAGSFLKERLESGDLLLVKGSRSAGMEKVIERLND